MEKDNQNNEVVKKSLGSFQKIIKEKEKREKIYNKHNGQKMEQKEKSLLPMRMMLKKIVDAGLIVNNANCYHLSLKNLEDQEFKVYEADSSPSWRPGTSLYIDHPARIEIAVPNNVKKEGELIIRFSSEHPDANDFNGRVFNTSQDACKAFASFLANHMAAFEHLT